MTGTAVDRPRYGWLPTIGVRARILATVLVLAGLGMIVTGAASTVVAHRQRVEAIDADLRTEVDEFRTHAARLSAEGTSDVRTLLRLALGEQVPMREQVLLCMINGVPAFVTRGERPFPLERESALIAAIAALPPDAPTVIRQADTVAAGTIRYAAVQVQVRGASERAIFVVATSLDPAYRQLAQTARQYAVMSAAALLLIGVGGWLVAGRLLRPLRLLRAAADRISHTDLTARIPITGHDDVTELTVTVNRMLDRLESAFDTQQQFLDDAGHELRTPLTIIRGHLDVLDVDDPAEVAATGDIVTDELDRMARLVDDLVLLAQSRRPDFLRTAPVDLDRLLREALDKAQALAERRWVLDATPQVVVLADVQRLTQALLQLADNAVKHTGPRDVVAFGGMEAPGGVLLWVRDSGAGVPEQDVERIFERFQRAAVSRGTAGSGLGLSIVAGIAAAHGGRVTLDQGAPGARFSLVLPLRVVYREPRLPSRRFDLRNLPSGVPSRSVGDPSEDRR